MAYLNKIDINGRTYYLQHLTDGKNEAKLPALEKDDQLLLQSQVINSVTSKDSQNGWRVPLSAAQGYSLNTKLNQEVIDREADVDEEQARAEDAELVLTNNLNQEIQDRIDDVDAEETRALAAEKVLTDNLAQEVQNRIDDVDAEEARALAAEKVLTDNLAQEITDRTNAVTAEQSRAEGVESDHESRIATMETFFKEADIDASQEFIDTLKEIQTYIDEDKTGAAAMTSSIRANEIAIQNEVDRASDAEADLQIQINGKVDSVSGSGLLSSTDKEKYDGYAATIASLQQQIDELKALVESYHPVTETE